MLIQQEKAITMLARGDTLMGNPVHQLASNGLCLRIGIGLLLGQDMPNGNQQFARNGDDRLLLPNACSQSLKLRFPMGVMLDRDPGGFNHDPTEITSTFLRDMPTTMSFTGIVNTSSQANISNQMFGRRKAGDIANSRQHTHDRENT